MAARKRKKSRGPKGDGYVTWATGRRRWRAVVRWPDGRTTSRYFVEQAEAEAWRRDQLAARQAALHVAAHPGDQLLLDALIAYQDAREARDDLAPNTLVNDDLAIRKLAAAFPRHTMRSLTATDVEAFDRANRKIMTGVVAAQLLTLLSNVYERFTALYPDAGVRNPVQTYRLLTPARARRGTALREAIALDPGMVRRLIAALDDDDYQPVIVWLVTLGIRTGELRGLRRVNIDRGVVHIVEQRRAADRHTPARLKNDHSPRDLPYPAALAAWTPRHDGDLLFPARDGGAYSEQTLRYHLNAACSRARIPRIRVHDLRHTCATGLINIGCPYHYVTALLGHSQARAAAAVLLSPTTAHYGGGIRVEALRPWVDEWAALVLPEGVQAVRETV